MNFSSTQSNLIGTFANVGMYSGGIPVGVLVDFKGPIPGVILGGALLSSGYFAMHRGMSHSQALEVHLLSPAQSKHVSLVPGEKFTRSLATAALNWPNHRGTATAFPLSAFGLGAFFFSAISSAAFPDNTSTYLLVLSTGCLGMCYVSVAFLRVVPQDQAYTAVSTDEERRGSNPLRRTKSRDRKHVPHHHGDQEPGTQPTDPHVLDSLHHKSDGGSEARERRRSSDREADETSSLMSKSSSSNVGDEQYHEEETKATADHDSHHVDIRGFALLKQVEFYQLWLLLGILTGVGLMTIK
ncbi:MAG: hypothetical protein Q9181_005210 [Wetmoreana brouardii]